MSRRNGRSNASARTATSGHLARRYVYSGRIDFTEVAHQILPKGYAHASVDGRYPVSKRQFYYAVREEFRKRTNREL